MISIRCYYLVSLSLLRKLTCQPTNRITGRLFLFFLLRSIFIFSPIVFTLYTADMELWLKTSKLFNFADNTTTDGKGKSKKEIETGLVHDAINVLQFMASNGLVANQSKTEFLLLNERNTKEPPLTEIMVGSTTITRTDHTKLLGIQIEESQEWNKHLKSTTVCSIWLVKK